MTEENFIEEKAEENFFTEWDKTIRNHCDHTTMPDHWCSSCKEKFREGIQKGREDKTNIEYQRAERYLIEIQGLEKELKEAEERGRELERERIEKIIEPHLTATQSGWACHCKTDKDCLRAIIGEKLKEGK